MIESAQEDLRNANRALLSCEADTYADEEGYTYYPDCEYEKEEVIECKRRLEHAEHNYNVFRREIRNLEISISEYQNPKVKYRTLIQFEKDAARSSLKQLINGAEDYLSISSPMNVCLLNGLGLAESVTKFDPTMVHSTPVGNGELIVMSKFSFSGLGGSLYSVSNKSKKGLVTTTYSEKGTEYICSELKIENKETGSIGKIVSVNIPSSLKNEKIGKYLVNNMEAICRANDCKEISGWANTSNVAFYQGLDYQTRNELKEAGAEVFKPLDSSFSKMQQNAKAAFESLSNVDFIKNRNLGKQQVNPMSILSPDEMNDEKFWQHHGENQKRYLDLIEKYDRCLSELNNGKTLEQIRKEDPWVANSYSVFHSTSPIKLFKSGVYYRIDSGNHRVAAAQMYFLKTGKTIPIVAIVIEKE